MPSKFIPYRAWESLVHDMGTMHLHDGFPTDGVPVDGAKKAARMLGHLIKLAEDHDKKVEKKCPRCGDNMVFKDKNSYISFRGAARTISVLTWWCDTCGEAILDAYARSIMDNVYDALKGAYSGPTPLNVKQARVVAALAHACNMPWGRCDACDAMHCTRPRWHDALHMDHVGNTWLKENETSEQFKSIEEWQEHWRRQIKERGGEEDPYGPTLLWWSPDGKVHWHVDILGDGMMVTIKVGHMTALKRNDDPWAIGGHDADGGRDMRKLSTLIDVASGAMQ